MLNTNLLASAVTLPVPAGPPIELESCVEMVNLRQLFRLDECLIVRVFGESMSPQINDGDMVLVNTVRSPVTGDVVVADCGDNEYTVKVYKEDERNGLRLVPRNSHYTEVVPRERCRILGIVTWIFSQTKYGR